MLKDLLEQVYEAAHLDDWEGSLIDCETQKVHSSFNTTIATLSDIITNPNSRDEDRNWARQKIDALL